GEAPRWEIFTHGGRRATGIEAIGYAREVAALGAGEILLTSMDRDGSRQGFDLELTRAVADAVAIPVIASGGVGDLDHLVAGGGVVRVCAERGQKVGRRGVGAGVAPGRVPCSRAGRSWQVDQFGCSV